MIDPPMPLSLVVHMVAARLPRVHSTKGVNVAFYATKLKTFFDICASRIDSQFRKELNYWAASGSHQAIIIGMKPNM